MALKKKEIEEYKKRLEELKSQLSKSVRGVSEDVKSPDEQKGYSQHQADEGTDDFGRTISLEVTAKEMNIIKQIDRALAKIEDGTYGKCDISGDDIPVKRLDAIPYATMTVASQEKLEQGLI